VVERIDLNQPIQAVYSLVRRQFELDDIQIDSTPGRGATFRLSFAAAA